MDSEQQRRALELCNMACRLRDEGPLGWQVGFNPIEVADLRIEHAYLPDEVTQKPRRVPNGITISWLTRTVLTIQFVRDGEPRVLCYEGGDWENEPEFLLTPAKGSTQ
jgi:hypothetical protein